MNALLFANMSKQDQIHEIICYDSNFKLHEPTHSNSLVHSCHLSHLQAREQSLSAFISITNNTCWPHVFKTWLDKWVHINRVWNVNSYSNTVSIMLQCNISMQQRRHSCCLSSMLLRHSMHHLQMFRAYQCEEEGKTFYCI